MADYFLGSGSDKWLEVVSAWLFGTLQSTGLIHNKEKTTALPDNSKSLVIHVTKYCTLSQSTNICWDRQTEWDVTRMADRGEDSVPTDGDDDTAE